MVWGARVRGRHCFHLKLLLLPLIPGQLPHHYHPSCWQVGADSVVRSLALAGLRIVEAPAAEAHTALSGTPLEPYANPCHPHARPGELNTSS